MDIQEICSMLDNTYSGKTWYGKNINDTLKDLPVGKALLRLQGSYNIAELVHHMIAWRFYVIKVLQTGEHHPVPDYENFPLIEVMTMEDWEELMQTFSESQTKLLDEMNRFTFDLNSKLTGKSYRYKDVLIGIIHHDIYHAGQLNLLAKFL